MSKRVKTSDIWNFFTQDCDQFAKCNICKKKISYKTTNSNMRKHMKTNHPTVLISSCKNNKSGKLSQNTEAEIAEVHNMDTDTGAISNIPSTSATSENPGVNKITTFNQPKISTFMPKKMGVSANKKITDQLLKMFSLDFQPFRIVEDEGFRLFVTALNPSYEIPNRHSISKSLIPARYEECVLQCREILANCKSVCITTDCWSSINTESFIGVTAHFISSTFKMTSILLDCKLLPNHHTSINLAQALSEITGDWNLQQSKIVLSVSDNAANIKSAITKELGWKHFGCFAHSLNLVVSDALNISPNISSLIRDLKTIVGHFKRSAISNEKLMTHQINSGKQPLKLLQDVPTRWNSTFYMLTRFVELEEHIRSAIAVIDKDLPVLSAQQWIICKQLCQVLKPFEATTKSISGEKYATASLVIPLVNGLKSVCNNLCKREYHPDVAEIVLKLSSGLEDRFSNVERSNTLALCSFLDPRFKLLAFSDEKLADNIKKNVIGIATSKFIEKQRTSQDNITDAEGPNNIDSDSDEELSVWGSFKKTISKSAKPKATANSQAIIEVQRYLEDDLLPRNENPCKWWFDHKYHFPALSEIFCENFCALATSVPCERLFSKAGALITDRRNRLKANKARMLLFLNCNENLVKHCS